MDAPKLLNRNHPSYGCGQAVFLFSEGDRLYLVEADNSWKVQVLERLLSEDGSVSPTCQNLAIFRNNEDNARRSERVEVIEYARFMTDMVQSSRLLVDSAMSYSYRCSLSSEEAEWTSRRLEELIREEGMEAQAPVIPMTAQSREEAPSVSSQAIENKISRLEGGLVGLGFKKTQIKKWVSSLTSNDLNEDLDSLMRLGITQFTA
jgi:hypothetical protein